jgi:hypothetical protein
MQLVSVNLTPLQRRNRVAYAVTSVGAESPQTGEHVVLRDQSGAYFGAVCVETAYDAQGRGTHRLRIGAALPDSIAARRLARADFVVPDTFHEQVEQFLAEAAAFQAALDDRGARR